MEERLDDLDRFPHPHLAVDVALLTLHERALHALLLRRTATPFQGALALPLHGALEPDQVRFIVQTLKDSSVNVGAGAAIY